ncbi:AraC family transcriptional regulator [Erythrobacter sp. JK5]|uniref:AraC family transcriptional regulator n=1 Tax=Erythrobacter sp. JK5 TaxID=2829500 RepID=UPI001BA47743|nr:AraC family transcriptional regulator [Erythrobacter sp. JK5]QUL36872.1 AraC family transcriptional regulator [Erythrobacter sp. JK5]
MNVLDDILSTLNLKGVLYFRTDLSSPWAVAVPELDQAARFHLCVQGTCFVGFASGDRVELKAGDLILVPRGRSHTISCSQADGAPALESVLADAEYDGEGVLVVGDGDPNASTQLICGHFSFRNGADHPLLRALPDYLLTCSSIRAREVWLDEVLRLLTRRMFSEGAVANATITRLSEVFFIELLRLGVGRTPEMTSLLKALSDRQIGKALQLMHRHAEQPWTVSLLASEVGMSRSSFADRFSELLGMGPMSYLSEWRLQKALSLLEDTRCSVQQAAAGTGYQSPAAFTRAFTSRFGCSPRELKRRTG